MTGKRHPAVRQDGFTLLGLLFMVAGMGVAMAALGTLWHTASQREKERELLFAGHQYKQAIESFWNASPGEIKRLPKNFGELLADPRFPNTVRHLRKVYRDPMTGSVDWGLVKEADGTITGVYSLSESAPFKTAGFERGDASFADAASYRDWVFRFEPAKATTAAGGKNSPAAQAGQTPASGDATQGD